MYKIQYEQTPPVKPATVFYLKKMVLNRFIYRRIAATNSRVAAPRFSSTLLKKTRGSAAY